MSLRRISAAAVVVCALLLAVPMSALASTRGASASAHSAVAVTSLKGIPITGKAKSGKMFKLSRRTYLPLGGQIWPATGQK